MSKILAWFKSVLPAPVQAKAKAFVAAVLGAVLTYAVTAITNNQTITLRGLENAAVAAVALFLGVHQTSNRLTPHGKHAGGHTVTKRRIPEVAQGGKLGRHVNHDSRSLAYLVKADGTVASASWKRETPILDQGSLGSCVGNATVGCLGTDPFYPTMPTGTKLDEAEAVAIYSAAEKIDGGAGYPPEDQGSSGLSGAKAAKNAGLISGYTHITSVAAAQTAIQTGPFIVGSDWYTGMDNPLATGLVTATGTIRGGHEYLCFAYEADVDLWWFDNSWGESWGRDGTFNYSSATFKKLLASDGDATVFTPLGANFPVPIPTPAPTPVPTPSPTVLVDDQSLVAHISELAVKAKQTPHDWLAARLHKLYPSA